MLCLALLLDRSHGSLHSSLHHIKWLRYNDLKSQHKHCEECHPANGPPQCHGTLVQVGKPSMLSVPSMALSMARLSLKKQYWLGQGFSCCFLQLHQCVF